MRTISVCRFFVWASLAMLLFSCSRETEDYDAGEELSSYLPLQVGKYITYRIDSLVTNDFNAAFETHSYQVKHVVDAELTDNEGRPSYRIYRYLNNEDGTGNWEANGSYFITPLTSRIEVVENNLRFIKLTNPLREGFSWRGNSYLPSDPLGPLGYEMSIDESMSGWDYFYDLFEPSTEINGQTYTDVWTVEQSDEAQGDPVFFPDLFANKARSVEKYSKGIGLVYRQFIMWEYETGVTANPSYTGYGITMWMIDHN